MRDTKETNDCTQNRPDPLICTVSEADNDPTPTGHTRDAVRRDNICHRSVFVVLRGWEAQDAVLLRTNDDDASSCKTLNDMVHNGEAYQDAAERLIQQQLQIKELRIGKSGKIPSKDDAPTLVQHFRFHFKDAMSCIWGQLYECWCDHGDVVAQDMKRVSLADLVAMSADDDHAHALRLYLQRLHDIKVNRRMLKGYSSSDLSSYEMRPKPKVIFFDCDDTLYFDGWKTANQLTAKINEWCMNEVGLPDGAAYELYKKHGTALKGLLAEGLLDNTDEAIDEFLRKVHDIPIKDLIQPDPKLRSMLASLDPSIARFIFTASISDHAQRCIEALGVADMFEPTIIDVKACHLETKHALASFHRAMEIAGITNPEDCLFFDDSIKNIQTARQVGWRGILVGRIGRDSGTAISTEHAEVELDTIHDMRDVFPELFSS